MHPPESGAVRINKQVDLANLMLNKNGKFYPPGLNVPSFIIRPGQGAEINSDHTVAKMFLEMGTQLDIPNQLRSMSKDFNKFNEATNASFKAIFTIPGQGEARWYNPKAATNNKQDALIIRDLFTNLEASPDHEGSIDKNDLDIAVVTAFSAGRADVAFFLINEADKFGVTPRQTIMEYVQSGFFESVVEISKKYKVTDALTKELSIFEKGKYEHIKTYGLDTSDDPKSDNSSDKKVVEYLNDLFLYTKGKVEVKPPLPEFEAKEFLKGTQTK